MVPVWVYVTCFHMPRASWYDVFDGVMSCLAVWSVIETEVRNVFPVVNR